MNVAFNPRPTATSLLYGTETRTEAVEIGTKPGSPKKNYSEASSPQNQDYPIGNKVQTEDICPQHPAWPLLLETLGENFAHKTKLSSPRRMKNRGLSSQHQDYPPFKAFTIKIWANGTNFVSPYQSIQHNLVPHHQYSLLPIIERRPQPTTPSPYPGNRR